MVQMNSGCFPFNSWVNVFIFYYLILVKINNEFHFFKYCRSICLAPRSLFLLSYNTRGFSCSGPSPSRVPFLVFEEIHYSQVQVKSISLLWFFFCQILAHTKNNLAQLSRSFYKTMEMDKMHWKCKYGSSWCSCLSKLISLRQSSRAFLFFIKSICGDKSIKIIGLNI
jgi:hypothetical protein